MHDQGGPQAMRTLWGLPGATRGPRSRWSLDEIASATVELADEAGLEGVTLAAVAARIGMTTTALYRYVDDKETLVEILVDSAVGVPPALPGGDWREAASTWTRRLRDRYLEHPWLGHVRPGRIVTCPNRLAWLDALVVVLADAPVRDRLGLALALDGTARTFSLLAGASLDVPPEWLTEELARRHPALAAELFTSRGDLDSEFTLALDTLLRGAATSPGHDRIHGDQEPR